MGHKKLVGLVVVLGAWWGMMGGVAEGIVIRADSSDLPYRDLAANPAYASVGQFYGTSGSAGFYASGTLISSDWVLTAAHVVDSATSLTFTVGGTSYGADQWLAHPNWTGNLWAGYDIGLVHLATPVANVAPAVRYTGSKEKDLAGTVVGYGMNGTGITGAKTFDGLKRAAMNTLDVIQNGRLLLCDFDNPRNRRDNSMGSATPLKLEGLIAPGDSGGGVFITLGGQTYLAGVNSFVAAWDGRANSDYGDVSAHIRVSAFNDWIDGIIGASTSFAAASADSGFSALAMPGASPVPEPSSFVILAIGGLSLAAWGGWKRRGKPALP